MAPTKKPRPPRTPKATPLSWAQLTWPEIAELIGDGCDAVLLPCGAIEQHGPHLGTGMDTALANDVCAAVSAATGVPVLPALAYGCSLGHSHRWPGTLALSPQTLIALVTDIGDWLHAAGTRRLFLINSHVTNAAPLRCALEILRARHDGFMIAVINTAEVSARVRAAFFADAADWHANQAETALMLARAPTLARAELCKSSDDPDRTAGLVFAHPVNATSANGVTGTPSKATAAQGKKLFSWIVADLAKTVRRALREKPPLTAAYHSSSNP
ncbi:MAG: creatininase family protein [Verrucomicrobiota bacterium]